MRVPVCLSHVWTIVKVGLNIVEDTVVGGCTGSGLSGGQVYL